MSLTLNPTEEAMPVAKMMTKSATLSYLSEKTELSKKQIAELFEETLNLACKEAKNGFVLPGFGKLVLANRKARIGRNPQTGEPIKIPAKRVCKFRIAKSLKDTVLGKK
jgi:DNA-binding protein HU-beta